MIYARNRRRLPLVMPATVHVRRSYSESRYGQLHIATAYPSGGGFDECIPLICLHPAGSSARFFDPILAELGKDRSLYAPDFPGHGYSDIAANDPSVADLAAVVGEFIDSLRLRTVDIVGSQFGALVAIELGLLKPQQVRRLVLTSVPHYTPVERQAAQQQFLGSSTAMPDGSHLMKEWQRLQKSSSEEYPADLLTDDLADVLRSRRRAAADLTAMVEYPTAKRVAQLKQPGLLVRTQDEYSEQTSRTKTAYSQASLEELTHCGASLFAGGNHRAVQLIREFLDR